MVTCRKWRIKTSKYREQWVGRCKTSGFGVYSFTRTLLRWYYL